MKTLHLNIPIALCQHVLQEKLVNPFKLYLLLKGLGDRIMLTDSLKTEICKKLDYKSEKTIFNNISRLVELNWIGYKSSSKIYYIRAFETLLNFIDAPRSTGVKFCERDFKYFLEFLAGAFIGYLAQVQHYRNLHGKKAPEERQIGRTFQSGALSCHYYPVALKAMSKMLNRPLSTCQKLRSLACKRKYISIISPWEPLNIPTSQIYNYRKAFPDFPGRIKSIQGNAFYNNRPDLIKPNMIFRRRKCRRKKTEIYNEGLRENLKILSNSEGIQIDLF